MACLTHFIIGYVISGKGLFRKEGNVLFNDVLNTNFRERDVAPW